MWSADCSLPHPANRCHHLQPPSRNQPSRPLRSRRLALEIREVRLASAPAPLGACASCAPVATKQATGTTGSATLRTTPSIPRRMPTHGLRPSELTSAGVSGSMPTKGGNTSRSMPSNGWSGVSSRRCRVCFGDPSVPCTLGSRRREGLRRITGLLTDCLAMRPSLRSAAGSAQGTQLRESDVALFHDIKSVTVR